MSTVPVLLDCGALGFNALFSTDGRGGDLRITWTADANLNEGFRIGRDCPIAALEDILARYEKIGVATHLNSSALFGLIVGHCLAMERRPHR